MVGCTFFLEDSTDTVFHDIFVWMETFHAFGLDFYVMVDSTKGHKYLGWQDQYKESYYTTSLEEALKIYPKHHRILITKDGPIDLKGYKHPTDNVIYIFGPDNATISPKVNDRVAIRYPDQKRTLWSIQACSITLYDRLTKLK